MKFLVSGIFILLLSVSNAQTVNQGDQIVNLGFGFDPYYSFTTIGGVSRSAVGPVILGYEYIVTDKLGIGRIGAGGVIGQSFYNEKYSSFWSQTHNKTSRTAIVARVAYHFDLPVEKLDVYAGFGGGLYINNHTSKTTIVTGAENVSKTVRVTGGHYVFGGARYFFTNSFGAYLEFGHGFNAINGGVVLKI